MKTIEISAVSRTEIGKKATKAIRKQEHVPCVMYGKDKENLHFHAHKNEFKNLIYTPNSYIVNLTVDKNNYQAVLQSIDFHPVTDEILHIDFYSIDAEKPFKIDIPVKTQGFSKGVQAGGVLQILRNKLPVKSKVNNLPDELVLDVTELGIGDAIRINDLKKQFSNLEFLDPQSIVVSVNVTRLAKSMGNVGQESAEEQKTTAEK
jgi:large subunit ribosomal protein L25